MEAPLDKVWIENNKIVWAYKPKSAETHEYVRKDVFINEIVNYLDSKLYDCVQVERLSPSAYTNVVIRQDFIEDFKKYIKGK